MTADDVVEAMAQSLWAEFHRQKPERFPSSCPNPQRWRDLARAAIRAVTASGGLVVGEMPGPEKYERGMDENAAGVVVGWNAALAAVRAAAVKVQEV